MHQFLWDLNILSVELTGILIFVLMLVFEHFQKLSKIVDLCLISKLKFFAQKLAEFLPILISLLTYGLNWLANMHVTITRKIAYFFLLEKLVVNAKVRKLVKKISDISAIKIEGSWYTKIRHKHEKMTSKTNHYWSIAGSDTTLGSFIPGSIIVFSGGCSCHGFITQNFFPQNLLIFFV